MSNERATTLELLEAIFGPARIEPVFLRVLHDGHWHFLIASPEMSHVLEDAAPRAGLAIGIMTREEAEADPRVYAVMIPSLVAAVAVGMLQIIEIGIPY